MSILERLDFSNLASIIIRAVQVWTTCRPIILDPKILYLTPTPPYKTYLNIRRNQRKDHTYSLNLSHFVSAGLYRLFWDGNRLYSACLLVLLQAIQVHGRTTIFYQGSEDDVWFVRCGSRCIFTRQEIWYVFWQIIFFTGVIISPPLDQGRH